MTYLWLYFTPFLLYSLPKFQNSYFDVVNIDYYNAILGTPFLKKFKVAIDFAKDCLTIKDKIIHNQADEYKIREGNSQKNTAVNAVKTEKLGKNLGDSH